MFFKGKIFQTGTFDDIAQEKIADVGKEIETITEDNAIDETETIKELSADVSITYIAKK